MPATVISISAFSPREIVSELDRHIIGQQEYDKTENFRFSTSTQF